MESFFCKFLVRWSRSLLKRTPCFPINYAKFSEIHIFFISYTFINNAKLKLAKNQVKAKLHTEDELLPFENYTLSYPPYHSKIIGDVLKNVQKTSASI